MLMAVVVSATMTLRTMTTMLAMMQTPLSPMLDGSAVNRTMNLGDPLRGRAFRSNLRFAPISTAIPVASAPFGRCALRLPGGSLRSPPLPERHAHGSVRRRGAVSALSSSRRRSSRCSPRPPWLGSAALRASPVPASPSTGLLTAPCSRVRTSADSTARASAVVLRTTPCSPRCTSRRSSAAAAPMSRPRRRRFPLRSPSDSWLSQRPSAFRAHTRRISDAEVSVAVHGRDWLVMPRSLARLSAPGVPEIPATDRCSQTNLGYVAGAAPSRPCRAEHLSGFCRVTADSLEISCKHL